MDKYIGIDKNRYKDTAEIEEEPYRKRFFLEQHARIAEVGEIVVSSKDKPIIGTTALDTCFGIVFYDRKNKKGIVGHAYSSRRFAILQSMIDLLERSKQQVIEYTIVSGYRNLERHDHSEETELLNYLKMYCPKNIKLVPFQNLDVRVVQMC